MPNKTQPSSASVSDFLTNYPNQKVIPDCHKLIKIFEDITGQEPVMWSTMIGFGNYHYKYESGREGDFFLVGFSPSKVGITIYISSGYTDLTEKLAKLGKHKIGKSCLYIKSLTDIDLETLKEIIKFGYQNKQTLYEQAKK
jgi:Domain of unknown function (DU1801)